MSGVSIATGVIATDPTDAGSFTNPSFSGIISGVTSTRASSGTASPVTGTLTKTALATISIAAGTMKANSGLRISCLWSFTNSANNKVISIELGGVSIASGTRTTSASDFWIFEIWNRATTNSQVRPASAVPFQVSATVPQTSTIDMSIAQNLIFYGTLANTGETITLEAFNIELLNP